MFCKSLVSFSERFPLAVRQKNVQERSEASNNQVIDAARVPLLIRIIIFIYEAELPFAPLRLLEVLE